MEETKSKDEDLKWKYINQMSPRAKRKEGTDSD